VLRKQPLKNKVKTRQLDKTKNDIGGGVTKGKTFCFDFRRKRKRRERQDHAVRGGGGGTKKIKKKKGG